MLTDKITAAIQRWNGYHIKDTGTAVNSLFLKPFYSFFFATATIGINTVHNTTARHTYPSYLLHNTSPVAFNSKKLSSGFITAIPNIDIRPARRTWGQFLLLKYTPAI